MLVAISKERKIFVLQTISSAFFIFLKLSFSMQLGYIYIYIYGPKDQRYLY